MYRSNKSKKRSTVRRFKNSLLTGERKIEKQLEYLKMCEDRKKEKENGTDK